jgi:ABC-type cobalamin/Fe3+-siderophores transport system ATPase subunit
MDVDLTIKNYRRFTDQHPARLGIRRGLTALVGVNNAGKSSLLRFFYEFRSLFQALSDLNSGVLGSLTRDAGFSQATSVVDPSELFSVSSGDRNLELEFDLDQTLTLTHSGVPPPAKLVVAVRRAQHSFRSRLVLSSGVRIPQPGHSYTAGNSPDGLLYDNGQPAADLSPVFSFFRDISASVYIGPFRNAINVGSTEPYFDISVGQAFVKEWKRIKSGGFKRYNDRAIEVTNSIRSIFELDTLEINASDDEQTLQLIINNKSFRLPEIGSGMTQFIMALATAAIREPKYILIDEPELSLHPALQLEFLTVLASLAQEGVIFATHNIGLARAAADRVYCVYKVSDWVSRISPFEATPRLSELLGEMSYLGLKDLGYRKILLVEGATELKTIAQFLRAFKKEHEVVLLSMNGTNLINGSADTEIQLEEIRRVSDNVFALIDSERAAVGEALTADREGFKERCAGAKVECHVLDRRSIEHYLTENAIKRVEGDAYRALGPYEDRRTVSPMWSKHDNWKIAREMTRKDLEGTDLHTFLAAL